MKTAITKVVNPEISVEPNIKDESKVYKPNVIESTEIETPQSIAILAGNRDVVMSPLIATSISTGIEDFDLSDFLFCQV